MQTVDGIGGNRNRGVETKRHISALQIVVDGFRDAHNRHPEAVKHLARRRQSAVAAHDDESAHFGFFEVFANAIEADKGFVREVPKIVPPRGNIPATLVRVSGIKSASRRPSQPRRMPITGTPSSAARRTAARMTAFRPGQSPPPVKAQEVVSSRQTLLSRC